MTSNLVQRLRDVFEDIEMEICKEAADRIEIIEASRLLAFDDLVEAERRIASLEAAIKGYEP